MAHDRHLHPRQNGVRSTDATHPQHGDFIWYELLATEPDAAADFYGRILGWETRDSGQAGMDYRLFSVGGTDIGGMMKRTEDMPPPLWLGYIGVEDVDEATARIKGAGGSIHIPPTDIPDVGRFAMAADPQGAPFYVMRGDSPEASTAYQPGRDGHGMWNELGTSDPDAAFAFYATLFGWEKGEAMPMGEQGDYQFLTHGGDSFGAVMKLPPSRTVPSWTYCFRVPDIDAAHQRVGENGGIPTEDPVQVPGGIWVFEALDPQGARFYLGGQRRS